ncbi:MAG TPA: LpqB family beta-propeller domain-containing protein, partial [Gemmatimonadales bacterium]|nr:LpqB family beta-propeller domain-containing protein [Gemmatimonadales bacterium]
VYLAADLKHDRKVALKVLKPELAAVLGAERFVVEIKTTASLQHPHILPLFDSGTANGFLYYVMPYIQGETLRDKLNRETHLGIEESVRIATEVADALDYAHRNGVIHRDIKPENILLHDGRPMVADFGIALAVSAAAGGRMTETGLSLGTPHYMSPEQATADKDITARSDVYSLASVLYEMLTGHPPHTGASAQQIIMKIVTEQAAPVSTLRKSVPPNVAAAVARALEKLPADRFDSARTFAAALADPGFRLADGTTTTGPARADWRSRIALPAIAVAALLALALAWSLRPAPPLPVTRYQVALPAGQGLSGSPWSRLAVSPDGSRLVYLGEGEPGRAISRLFLRTRDQLDAAVLPGTEGAINPAFSPDGSKVAFIRGAGNGQVQVIALAGGPPVTVTDSVVGVPGLTWSTDGYIYYDMSGIGPLMRVPEAGGRAESIGQLDSTRGEQQHAWPDALPNGKGIIMTVSRGGPGGMGGPEDEIAVLDVATGRHRVLVSGIFARYARTGHLVYVTSEGTLMSVPFDQDRLALAGEPVALTDGVSVRSGGGAADLAISASGVLWYVAGGVGMGGAFEPVWVTRDGSVTQVVPGWTGLLSNPALSPDGKRLAIVTRDGRSNVRIRELDEGPLSRLTTEESDFQRPAWSPDGRSVAYVSALPRAGGGTFMRLADGSRPATVLLEEERMVEEVTFSPDGKWLVYRAASNESGRDLYGRRIGTDSSVALVATPAVELSPAISPDGRWLAYVSFESGRAEVYVRPFPNTEDGRWQVSTDGGQEPVWAHSGRELFYRSAPPSEPRQMVMSIRPGATFEPGDRRVLFPLSGFNRNANHPEYAVAPGDQRFLMIRSSQANVSDRLVVVENFFELLRTRLVRP